MGYLKVDNTKIDTTVVKHNDNSFYLNHSFDKSPNSAGWVFADCRNTYDGTDRNYVIFGHARLDGSMLGTLKKVLTDEWQKKDNNIIYITENNKYLLKPFSVYKIKAEEYYITTHFKDNSEFNKFINIIKSRSIKDFKIKVSGDDKILTLSTCDSNNQYRIVLHAKIIETK